MKANLFIAGACKSGTTFLHDVLSQQDDILGASPKEPYFFELPKKMRSEEDYHSKYFNTHNDEKYLLDSRHRTMFFSGIPKDLYDYNPKSKLIFILRNPIERAYSHWWMWYSRGVIKTSFDKTVRNEIKSIEEQGSFMDISPENYYSFVHEKSYKQRFAYADANTIVESGYYFEQIQRFHKYFDTSNMLILNFDMLSNMSEVNPILSQFLNIKISDSVIVERKNIAKSHKRAKYFFAPLVPKSIKLKLKNMFLKKPKIPQSTYNFLQNHYKNRNEKLINEFNLHFVNEWQNN